MDTITVLDDSQRNDLPTGRVTVTTPEGATDAELAEVAGYGSQHFGYSVCRSFLDDVATVELWND